MEARVWEGHRDSSEEVKSVRTTVCGYGHKV